VSRALAAALAGFALAGCSGQAPPPQVEKAPPGSPVPSDGGSPLAVPATSIAAPASPGRLPVEAAQARAPDGITALFPDATATVAPTSSYLVRIGVRVPEARLVLVDAQDSILPASGSTELGAATSFELAPADPLRPGATYVLRLEGLSGRLVRDSAGRLYEPVSFRVIAAGKAPEPARRRTSKPRPRDTTGD